ncbi:hypothetical protein AAFF_G00246930 [Aldrovandia affinis]|uniref:Lysine-specific demethylase n=1 Tax=Aldrovandia affinis TaxID=143900 RepID=A0AAD7SU73_9TELE|nr:hypothetical protein AAFF_G00246930 [Aldrovandia affinis]
MMGDSLGLVGKRLLLLFRDGEPAVESKATQAVWKREWLRGTVRAVSVIGLASPGVEVFVEFKECPWRRRSWVQVYGEEVCAVLVESAIVWAACSDTVPPRGGSTTYPAWPALSFRPLVDRVGLGSLVPVESFLDRTLHFLPDGDSLQRFEVEKDVGHALLQEQPSLQAAVRSWHREFELQEILRRGSYTIEGRRVRVYQPEFDEPWALGLVSRYNSVSHIMEVTIDQSQETQLVDPRVIHVMLAEDLPEEAGKTGWRKESDGGKGENGRRRRNASEGDGDVALKRPKGAGEGDAEDDKNRGGARNDGENEDATTWAEAAAGGGGGGGGGRGGGVSNSLSALALPSSVTSQCQPHTDGRAPAPHTPTPPPLKPAPVPPLSNTSFPSAGHMPRLTRAASPKPTPSATPERDERTAAQVNSSSPQQVCEGGGPPSASNAPLSSSQKPPTWRGTNTESPKSTILATPGFQMPSRPVFGERCTGTQANGAVLVPDSRSFGFSFGGEGEPALDTRSSQNLFFHCMSAGGQGSADGCFPMESLSKDALPSLAKPTAPSDTQRKAGGLFGTTLLSTADLKEEGKGLEPLRTGDGTTTINLFGGDDKPKLSPAFPGVMGSGLLRGSSLGLGALGTAGASVGGGLGLLTGGTPSESHKNLFLQAPKSEEPANPFLIFAENKVAHGPFSNLAAPQPPSAVSPFPTAAPGSVVMGTETFQAPADSQHNLFAMSESPKTLLSSPSSGLSPSPAAGSVLVPKPTTQPRAPEALLAPAPSLWLPDPSKEETGGAGEGSSVEYGFPALFAGGVSGHRDTPLGFEASPQKFSLDERGLKQESDSSTNNSDLSDLSEAEDMLDHNQNPETLGGGAEGALLLDKSKGVGRGRPRNKPFTVGLSVLKDAAKLRRLKQSGEPFLQDGSCINVAPHLHKCRECRLERYRKSREQEPDEDDSTVACRFYHFRRLAFTRKGVLRVEGFLSPQQSDPQAMGLWLPSPTAQESLDLDISKYILANVGDHFCQLVMSEKEAMMMVEPHQKVAWKRAVRGIREMCDVCETTLFNIHWVCRKCGFGVCLDCYRLRKSRPMDVVDEGLEEDIIPGTVLYSIGDMVHSARGKWGIKANCPCASRHTKPLVQPAAPNGLSQARVNSSSSGTGGGGAGTEVTAPKAECETPAPRMEVAPDGGGGTTVTVRDMDSSNMPTTPHAPTTKEPRRAGSENASSSALHWLADLATQKAKEEVKADSGSLRSVMAQDSHSLFGLESFSSLAKASPSSYSSSSTASPKLFNSLLLGSSTSQPKAEGSSLRDLLNSGPEAPPGVRRLRGPLPFRLLLGEHGGYAGNSSRKCPQDACDSKALGDKAKGNLPNFLDHIIASVVETKKTEVRRGRVESGDVGGGGRRDGVMALSVLDPHTSHSWLCDGRLLCLLDPGNTNNWKIFRECWKQGQPVLVAGVHKKLKEHLWRPEAFSKEFGDQYVDLVNCRNCSIISDIKVRDFWDGFEVISKRLKGGDGQPMALKLKDWPPGEDFRDMMPTRFDDLMDNLPLPEYTKRDGRLNLASRLPNFFVRPDLGPKMYNAYGLISTEDRKVGTTNLHLDVSDAVNVMVYVGIPRGEGDHEGEADITGSKEVMLTIKEGDVDEVTKRRIYEANEKPGALWHIYGAKDAEKIRELLRKVGEEQGQENPPDHDPIHDQSWYLDQVLRRRLHDEYGVQGWGIVQFLGDAVFIPAGAPHQVHNLYSCIKVAEDFVSPEHVKHCFSLTQEFRHLSTTHTNHEDKLQVKNIIYHAVKDSVGTLKSHEPKMSR